MQRQEWNQLNTGELSLSATNQMKTTTTTLTCVDSRTVSCPIGMIVINFTFAEAVN